MDGSHHIRYHNTLRIEQRENMTELPIRIEFNADNTTHEKIFDWAMKTLGEGNFDYFVSADLSKAYYCFRTKEDAELFKKQFMKQH